MISNEKKVKGSSKELHSKREVSKDGHFFIEQAKAGEDPRVNTAKNFGHRKKKKSHSPRSRNIGH